MGNIGYLSESAIIEPTAHKVVSLCPKGQLLILGAVEGDTMGNIGYIFGYGLIFAFLVGVMVGYLVKKIGDKLCCKER